MSEYNQYITAINKIFDYLAKMKYTKQTWTMKFVQNDKKQWTIKTIAITKG